MKKTVIIFILLSFLSSCASTVPLTVKSDDPDTVFTVWASDRELVRVKGSETWIEGKGKEIQLEISMSKRYADKNAGQIQIIAKKSNQENHIVQIQPNVNFYKTSGVRLFSWTLGLFILFPLITEIHDNWRYEADETQAVIEISRLEGGKKHD